MHEKFSMSDPDGDHRKCAKKKIICSVIVTAIVLSLGIGLLVHFLAKDKPPHPIEVVGDTEALYPLKYSLELEPNTSTGILHGNMKLLIRCTNSSSKVVLNSIGIQLIKESLVISETNSNRTLTFLHTIEEGTLTFQLLDSTFQVGLNYTISLSYEATINHHAEGVFQTEPDFVATHFQPNYAAKAFPCFDDPRMKAIFQLTIVRRVGLISLSNTEISHHENRSHNMVADVYTETPKMSTYLAAFVICDYKYVEQQTSKGLKIRFYSQNPTEHLMVFVNFTRDSLEFFANYFDMDYTLPKLDVVPVNNPWFAGMENWGLVLLSDSFLLEDVKDVNTLPTKDGSSGATAIPIEQLQRSLKLIVHEVIHQWIGNVVTIDSWMNNWLIEGLTDYLGLRHIYKLNGHFLKNKEDLDFLRLKTMSDVYIGPVNELAFKQEINRQGPLVFLILEEILGEEKLRDGIRAFLQKYKMKNAGEDEFWDCFQEFMPEKDILIRDVMKRWTGQENYPIVTVTKDSPGHNVHVTQKKIYMSYTKKDEGKWTIPFTFSDSENKTQRHFYLKPEKAVLKISVDSPRWYMANNHGFYRVNYDVTNWQNLIQQLLRDHTVIKPVQRANLISDSWALAKFNILKVDIFLSLLDYMDKETEYLPWMAFLGTTSELISFSRQSEDLPTYMYFFQEKIKNIYQKVAWIDDGLSLNDRMLQKAVINEACKLEYPACISKATHLFKNWKTNPEENKIPTQYLMQVMCIGIRQGGTRDCLFVKDQLKTQPTSIAYRMHYGLSCSTKPWILQSYLNDIVKSDDFGISQLPTAFVHLARNPQGVAIVKRFLAEECYEQEFFTVGSNYTMVSCQSVIKAVSTVTDMSEFDDIIIGRHISSTHDKRQEILHAVRDSWAKNKLEKGVEYIKELFYKKKKTLSANMRLPQDLVPVFYDMEIQPEIYEASEAKFYFHGSIEMHVVSIRPVKMITFHADSLEISNVTVHTGDNMASPVVPILSTSTDEEKQMFNILLGTEIAADANVTVKLKFRGNLRRQMSGLYLSSYYKRGELVYLATTQFEPTSARKAFPCFDEPQLKAKFIVKIVRRKDYKSISNTKVKNHTELGNGWIRDTYYTTPTMSTYLLAFIVCDFNYTISNVTVNNRTEVGIWAREEYMDQTSWALESAVSLLGYYARYFQSPYPMNKVDLIAIPDFAAGAMENWGLITYRETNLLYDDTSNSREHYQYVTLVVAHELAHQWFGNLVTMCWWNDIWLNEGFATYVSYLGMDNVFPEWKIFDYFVINTIHTALEADGSSASHPLNVPIRNRHDIMSAFDDISYAKGASILHMLRFCLGENIFKNGLRRYISLHSFSNAQHNDLWMAFNQEAHAQNQTIDVNETMKEWVSHKNYPVVSVQWRDSQLVLSQKIFLYDDSLSGCTRTSAKKILWKVPFTYTTDQEMDFNKSSHDIIWLTSERMTLNATEKSSRNQSWVMGNLKQFGFYRVNYELSNWKSLIDQLKTNHSVIPATSRAQLINDAWSLAKTGMLSNEIPFKMLEYLVHEQSDIPLKAVRTETNFLKNILKKRSIYGLFEDFMRRSLKDTYINLKNTNSSVYTTVFKFACAYGLPECIEEAKQQFLSWKNNIKNRLPNPIVVADIRETCYCVGIQYGTKEDWNIVYQDYLHVIDAKEKRRLLYSLSCTTQLWLLEKFFLKAMGGVVIRAQDLDFVTSAISNNPIGSEIIWKYIKQDWDKIKRQSSDGFSLVKIVMSATMAFVDELQLQEVEKFMDDNPDLGDARHSFDSAVDQIRTKVKWLKRNYAVFKTWLADQNLPSYNKLISH